MAEETKNQSSKLIAPIIIVLLLVASFLAGTIFKGGRPLKSGESGQAPDKIISPTIAPQAFDEETVPEVLGEADLIEIEKSVNVKGNPNAKVTIVEFSEFQCPFCKRYFDETYNKIWEEYGNKINYIFRDYPLPFHPLAQITAEAARCAGDQGKYWDYHNLLFSRHGEWSNQTDAVPLLTTFAVDLKLNEADFSACLSSGKYTQSVKDDLALGQRLGIGGTPSFFINGRLLVGAVPFESFKAIIDEELQN